jgi:hypothetical protein
LIIPFAPALIGLQVVLAADALPHIDIEKTCRQSEKTLQGFAEVGVIYRSCFRAETDARTQMQKDWRSYPAADKTRCIQPKNYMPSYVEWLTCLEMQKHLRDLRPKGSAQHVPARGQQRAGRGA